MAHLWSDVVFIRIRPGRESRDIWIGDGVGALWRRQHGGRGYGSSPAQTVLNDTAVDTIRAMSQMTGFLSPGPALSWSESNFLQRQRVIALFWGLMQGGEAVVCGIGVERR